ncbi:MAG: ComEA family DNA-binding protein [Dehalogenimonas sp.]|uniref:ComEA family DNA-binding protein n=1 Tax=Candidatus Dehalogenimonas loeffleri TaxID=3127115 RepID=A0ABZ2J2Q4_9CHLR|nr:ComEA family DNA-binding protein [Dehalogenimonas sp.]
MRQLLRKTLILTVILLLWLLSACAAGPSYVEIYTPQTNPAIFENIIIEGDVQLPGIYPLTAGDTLEALLEAAGGSTGGSIFKLVVGTDANVSQKVNLNTAPNWLLTALPGVGEAKANAIIEYRAANGAFINIMELMKVPGFGQGLFDSLKDLITVAG